MVICENVDIYAKIIAPYDLCAYTRYMHYFGFAFDKTFLHKPLTVKEDVMIEFLRKI